MLIDAPRRKPVKVKAKRRKAPTPAPQTRRPDFGGAPAPRRTLPKNFKTEATQPTTRPQRRAAARVQKRVAKRVVARRKDARALHFPKDLPGRIRSQQQDVVRDFGRLKLSDPKRYEERKQEVKRDKRGWTENAVRDAANWSNKALTDTAKYIKESQDEMRTREKRMGLPDVGVTGATKEVVDIVANTPSGAYMAGAAVKEAAQGRPQRGKKLVEDFKKTSALYPAVKGDFGEAAKRAKDRPITTALELSGVKAVAGRTTGAAMRATPGPTRRIASTKRENLRLYDPKTEGKGPEIQRRYSKDVVNKGIQVAAERRARKGSRVRKDGTQRRPARDPNVDAGVRLVPTNRMGPDRGPVRQRLKRRVDTRVFAQQRAMEQRKRVAEKEAKAASRNRRVEGALEQVEARPSHAPSSRAVETAFKRAGGKLPVVVRPFRSTDNLSKRRGGYAGIRRDPATGREHHLVYYNPNHGAGARNAALWHELGRALYTEKTGDFNPTTKMTPEEYQASPSYVAAKDFAERNMDGDLMEEPPRANLGREQSDRVLAAQMRADLTREARHSTDAQRLKDIRELQALPDNRLVDAIEASRMGEHVQRRLDDGKAENRYLLAQEFGVRTQSGTMITAGSSAKARALAFERGNTDLVPFKINDNRYALVPSVVAKRFEDHRAVDRSAIGPGSPLDRATNVFKDVVLTTASPSRWIGGNVADIGMRTLLAGITPLDIARGVKGSRVLQREGLQGEQANAALTGGGLYTAAEALSPKGLKAPSKLNVPVRVWQAWKGGVYRLEHGIEVLPQYGAMGKAMRQDTTRMKTDLKALLKLHDDQVTGYFQGVATDRAMEARIQKATEDVIGRWGKVSPTMRRSLSIAPFAQWLGAATRYTYVTLPVHHPIKTGIIAGISEMTEEERTRLGLSYFAEPADRMPDYQMGTLPIDVGKNKYGPTVEGIRTSRMTSLGTAGSAPWNLPEFLLPQIAGGFNALQGQSFTGEELEYPGHWPESHEGIAMDMMDRLPVAAGAQIESMVPFASAFRRSVLEGGRPSAPHSTILTPATRPEFNYETNRWEDRERSTMEGLKKWAAPFAPKSRLYTLGAGRDIERSQQTLRQLEKWNARREAQGESGDIFEQKELDPGEEAPDERDLFKPPSPRVKQPKNGPRDIFR